MGEEIAKRVSKYSRNNTLPPSNNVALNNQMLIQENPKSMKPTYEIVDSTFYPRTGIKKVHTTQYMSNPFELIVFTFKFQH